MLRPGHGSWPQHAPGAPDHGADARHPVVVDVDATLVTSHSEKEQARPTFKKGFGSTRCARSSTTAAPGTGEPLAIALRPGNAGSNTATDHIAVISAALRQLPAGRRGKSVLVRIDGAGSTHEALHWLTGRRLAYPVGFTLPDNTPDAMKERGLRSSRPSGGRWRCSRQRRRRPVMEG